MERYEKPEMEVIVFNEEEIRTEKEGGTTSAVDLKLTPGTFNQNF